MFPVKYPPSTVSFPWTCREELSLTPCPSSRVAQQCYIVAGHAQTSALLKPICQIQRVAWEDTTPFNTACEKETSATAHLAKQKRFYFKYLTCWDHTWNKAIVILPAISSGDFKGVAGNSAPTTVFLLNGRFHTTMISTTTPCWLSAWQVVATSQIAAWSQGNTKACWTASFLLLGFS